MHAWKQLRGEIQASTRHNFERLALSLLRLDWPDLILSAEGDQLDRAGIDLASGIRGTHVSRAVQCKGFSATEDLEQSGIRQIRESIDALLNSSFTCTSYYLFHNRDSRDPRFVAKAKAELQRILDGGRAKRVKLWDRQTFVRDYTRTLKHHLMDRLRDQSLRQLERIEQIFDFGDVYVTVVPVSEMKLVLTRGEIPRIEPVASNKLEAPARLASSSSEARWTLLMGLYGTGKSSTALRAARHTQRLTIYARCAEMNAREGGVGTNSLMETVIRSLNLFEEMDETSRDRLIRLSGSLLRAALIAEDNDALLILDGLDENRQYATARGMMALSSSLAELRCPILLTTRQEHFNSTLANYDELLSDHSIKGGARRHARVFRLEPWEDAQVLAFLNAAVERSGDRRSMVRRLRERLKAGQIDERELSLLRHPLFLQMITALAANGEEAGTTGAAVLGRWTSLKLRRDLEVNRALPAEPEDIGDYLRAMHRTHERIAAAMTESDEEREGLKETILAAEALEALALSFPSPSQTLASLTSASLVVPLAVRTGAAPELMFSHRLFQEYYLARHLVNAGETPDGYPPEVIQLCNELREAVQIS